MSNRFLKNRQFNNTERHPYTSQYKSLPESNCQVAPSVGGMLFALPVGGVNIWPIGWGISWGTMDACQLSHHGTNYSLGCISGLYEFLSHSEKLCMGPGPPKFTQDVSKG